MLKFDSVENISVTLCYSVTEWPVYGKMGNGKENFGKLRSGIYAVLSAR